MLSLRRRAIFLLGIGFSAVSYVHADYSVYDKGTWPKSWPKELDPLRKQSRTIQGSLLDLITYHVPFTIREEFEAAWPHILKVKSKGAPVILLRSPSNHWHFGKTNAGVLIHSPPPQAAEPQAPLLGLTNVRERWMWTTYIELVVDGKIVDLNRIPLPADTPIIDERFAKQITAAR
jgi:hypothetical protein